MASSQTPTSLVVLEGAMTMDGGSIFLRCVGSSSTVDVSLDWSIDSRRRGCPQLSVDGRPIPRGSHEEGVWLRLLEQSDVQPETLAAGEDRISPNALVLSEDIGDYLSAIRRGPRAALQHLVRQLVTLARSSDYQSPVSGLEPFPRPDPLQPLRDLLAKGARQEAIRWYRAHHPDVPLFQAIRIVD
jgi:hypothetical protein